MCRAEHLPVASSLCNLDRVVEIGDVCTIDVMVAEAQAVDPTFTTRKIRYWTTRGLLDYPEERRPRNGHGSDQALYPATQRRLLQSLVRKPRGLPIRTLAQFPVWVWMYGGDEFVPTRQARRALMTALGFRIDLRKEPSVVTWARPTLESARDTARRIDSEIASVQATDTARTKLRRLLTHVYWSGRIDDHQALEEAIRDVFEPEYAGLIHFHKEIGHPSAPFTTQTLINETRAQLTAINALKAGKVTDQDLTQARDAHPFAQQEWVRWQSVLATASPPGSQMYPSITPEDMLNKCCGWLLREVARQIMEPDVAEDLRRARFALPRPTPAELGLSRGDRAHSTPQGSPGRSRTAVRGPSAEVDGWALMPQRSATAGHRACMFSP